MKIFSGVRPTGNIHLGNYLGSIRQWVKLQENNECYFSVVDWHAITTPYEEDDLQEKIFELAVTYLSVGLDPKKCIFFVQSHVKEHAELCWLLGSITPLGELQRMTQFKDKSKQHKEYINAGLLNYPILMAADILLYMAKGVPVGKDQKQHVEFTRNLAQKFNKKFGETFTLPEPIIPETQSKIMSLKDAEKKMSKSGDQKGCITLFEDEESIRKKIMSAQTDNDNKIIFDEKNKKGISNLLSIYSALSEKSIKELEKEYNGKTYAEFKKDLSDILIIELGKFKEKRDYYYKNPEQVKKILNTGAEKAKKEAEKTMKKVRKKMGLD